jgi:DNA recombination protein RmuC
MTWLLVALAALNLVLVVLLLMRPRGAEGLRESLREDTQREAREVRSEVQDSARGTRQELTQALALFQQTLLTQQGDVARTQNEQIDSFRTQLAQTQQQTEAALRRFSDTLADQLQKLSETNEDRKSVV